VQDAIATFQSSIFIFVSTLVFSVFIGFIVVENLFKLIGVSPEVAQSIGKLVTIILFAVVYLSFR